MILWGSQSFVVYNAQHYRYRLPQNKERFPGLNLMEVAPDAKVALSEIRQKIRLLIVDVTICPYPRLVQYIQRGLVMRS